MLKQVVVNRQTLRFQIVDRTAQINRVPEDDRSYHQCQTAGPIALIFEATVAYFTQTIKEYRSCQGILGLALVQSDLDAPTKFGVLQPLQGKERSFDATSALASAESPELASTTAHSRVFSSPTR